MRTRWAAMLVLGLAVVGCKRKPAPTEPAPDTLNSGPEKTGQPNPPDTVTPKGGKPHRAKNGLGTFTIGKTTTFVTGPFNDDGHIDYTAALNGRMSKGVTPENNANVLLWKALGPNPADTRIPSGYFEKLGIPAPPATGDYFIPAQRHAEERFPNVPGVGTALLETLRQLSQQPWAAKDHPDVVGWLKANEKPLGVVVEAAKRSRYYTPMVGGQTSEGERDLLFNNPFPGLQPTRELVTALAVRAMLSITEGQGEVAWRDLLACHRLARLIGQGATLIEGLVGIASERIATRGELVLLGQAKLTADQLKQYQKELASLPPMSEMAEKADLAERFMFLDGIMLVDRYGLGYLERLGGMKETPAAIAEAGLNGIDWNIALETTNGWFDRLAAAMRHPTPAGRIRALDQVKTDMRTHQRDLGNPSIVAERLSKLEREKGMSRMIGDSMITVLPIIAAQKVQESSDQMRQTFQNVTTAFALAAYHRDNGKYPDKLDALVPMYLPKGPNDVFSGGALLYKPTANGYLLYSVGPNGEDDGGRGPDDQPAGDDIVVRMPR